MYINSGRIILKETSCWEKNYKKTLNAFLLSSGRADLSIVILNYLIIKDFIIQQFEEKTLIVPLVFGLF